MIIKKSMLGLGSVLVLSMLVVGCGGDDDDRPFDRNGVASQDAFILAVKAIVATTSDTTEPVSIDSITPTTRDNTEPASI